MLGEPWVLPTIWNHPLVPLGELFKTTTITAPLTLMAAAYWTPVEHYHGPSQSESIRLVLCPFGRGRIARFLKVNSYILAIYGHIYEVKAFPESLWRDLSYEIRWVKINEELATPRTQTCRKTHLCRLIVVSKISPDMQRGKSTAALRRGRGRFLGYQELFCAFSFVLSKVAVAVG